MTPTSLVPDKRDGKLKGHPWAPLSMHTQGCFQQGHWAIGRAKVGAPGSFCSVNHSWKPAYGSLQDLCHVRIPVGVNFQRRGPQQSLLNQRPSSGNLSLTGVHWGFHESRIVLSRSLLKLCACEITHTKRIISVSPRWQTLSLPDSHFPWSLSIPFRLLKVKNTEFSSLWNEVGDKYLVHPDFCSTLDWDKKIK